MRLDGGGELECGRAVRWRRLVGDEGWHLEGGGWLGTKIRAWETTRRVWDDGGTHGSPTARRRRRLLMGEWRHLGGTAGCVRKAGLVADEGWGLRGGAPSLG
ncbi:unnamed protein product [Cuscuta epithymum]|uniref:Uncharacterized protein n=1 Tax=Cuscuta epithymum TaxID=186058 RepID=A0AAV0C650_9ASTE|nr:unnamed protein product [Cuscuta epithymum]